MMPLRTVRRSKYGVRIDSIGKLERTCDGILFGSKRECARYGELKLLERAGQVRAFKVHPEFSLDVNGFHIGKYTADSAYYERQGDGWLYVVEDVKGGKATKTRDYLLRKRLMEAIYAIKIREVQ